MAGEKEVGDTMKRRGCFLLLGPPTLLLFIAQCLSDIVLTDLIVYRTCLVYAADINATDCLMLRRNSGSQAAMDLEAKVEPYASVIVMTKSLIEGILPAVISLFLGPWSDRVGRKPLLIAAFTGFTLQYMILSLMCNWNISPWYLLSALIPGSIIGGLTTVRIASLCYVSDITSEQDRMSQLALIDVSVSAGNVLGSIAGPYIYDNYGYTYCFGTAAACCGLAVIFTHFRIPETVKETAKKSICGLFRISSVRGLMTGFTTKGGNFHRYAVWLAISALTLNAMIYRGEFVIDFLFTRARLGWNVQHYSYLTVANHILRGIVLCGASFLSRVSGVKDTLLVTIGVVSILGCTITKSLVWQSWHMYLAVCIGIFTEIPTSSLQSIISKFVSTQDLGKGFSLALLLEILSSSGGAALYTLIYSHYLPLIYPSPVHLFSIGLSVLLIIWAVGIEVLIRKIREPPTYIATAQEDF